MGQEQEGWRQEGWCQASSSSSADNDSATSLISSSSDLDSYNGSEASAGATKGGKRVIVKSQKKSKSPRFKVQSKSSKQSKGKKPAVQVNGKDTMPINAVVHTIDSNGSLHKALIKAHERFELVSPKNLCTSKRRARFIRG